LFHVKQFLKKKKGFLNQGLRTVEHYAHTCARARCFTDLGTGKP
jgi:hypothetical protein